MLATKRLLILGALLFCPPGLRAQGPYQPCSRACVVDGFEVRPGFTAQYVYEDAKGVVGFCCTGCRTKFLSSPAMSMATAVANFRAGLRKKDKPVAPEATGPCDCKRCENKPILAEFRVKTGETEDRARISCLCEACKATACLEVELKHAEGCKPKLKRLCTKSGMAPHATVGKQARNKSHRATCCARNRWPGVIYCITATG